jgi:hypothetical protein
MSESIWTQSNGGETTTFWSCGICGASVQPMDKETHEKWHSFREKFDREHGEVKQPYHLEQAIIPHRESRCVRALDSERTK